MSRTLRVTSVAVLTVLCLATPLAAAEAAPKSKGGAARIAKVKTTTAYTVARTSAPAGSVVSDSRGRLAVFTDGSRTVTLRGPVRTFGESTTTATVTTDTWVRLLPAPFAGKVDDAWLRAAQADTSPDLLAVAMGYTTGAPATTVNGLQISGDASYGPLDATGARVEGSDFNDYLGIAYSYGSSVDAPEADQFRALDCSGFVRMVYGYRLGVPLSLSADGVRLPRRSVDMATAAPGVTVIADTGVRPTSLAALRAGDLLFFDADPGDGRAVDHVAVYLGVDSAGAPRFVSSRKSADGPTMGDIGGRSTLSGAGLYSSALRGAHRI